jgi:hypothetical protein
MKRQREKERRVSKNERPGKSRSLIKTNPIRRKDETRQKRKMRALIVVCGSVQEKEKKKETWTREWSGGYHRQPTKTKQKGGAPVVENRIH